MKTEKWPSRTSHIYIPRTNLELRRMKSNLEFFDYETHSKSGCGDVLEIEFSNANLGWPGIILEKGSSPHFYPTNVYTPYFYFAMALEDDLHWKVADQEQLSELETTPGEIWINPPRTPFTHEVSETCYFLILAVEENVFLSACGFDIKGEALEFINNYNVTDETIQGIMNLFWVEAKSNGLNGFWFVRTLLSLLVTHYIKSYSNYDDLRNSRSQSSKLSQEQLTAIDRYIAEHIYDAITIDTLANLVRTSKFYFLREFRKLVGITPYQYLLRKRLDKAKELLANPQQTIATIGFDLGFNDQPHFTRTFKRQFGITPGQFRKQ